MTSDSIPILSVLPSLFPILSLVHRIFPPCLTLALPPIPSYLPVFFQIFTSPFPSPLFYLLIPLSHCIQYQHHFLSSFHLILFHIIPSHHPSHLHLSIPPIQLINFVHSFYSTSAHPFLRNPFVSPPKQPSHPPLLFSLIPPFFRFTI